MIGIVSSPDEVLLCRELCTNNVKGILAGSDQLQSPMIELTKVIAQRIFNDDDLLGLLSCVFVYIFLRLSSLVMESPGQRFPFSRHIDRLEMHRVDCDEVVETYLKKNLLHFVYDSVDVLMLHIGSVGNAQLVELSAKFFVY